MKTAETFTLVLDTNEYCTTRNVLEKFEFFHTHEYKSLGSLQAEFDLDEDELITLRRVLEKLEDALERQ